MGEIANRERRLEAMVETSKAWVDLWPGRNLPAWTTREGVSILLRDMTPEHLANAEAFCARRVADRLAKLFELRGEIERRVSRGSDLVRPRRRVRWRRINAGRVHARVWRTVGEETSRWISLLRSVDDPNEWIGEWLEWDRAIVGSSVGLAKLRIADDDLDVAVRAIKAVDAACFGR